MLLENPVSGGLPVVITGRYLIRQTIVFSWQRSNGGQSLATRFGQTYIRERT